MTERFPEDMSFVMTDITKRTHIFQMGGESVELPQGFVRVINGKHGLMARIEDVRNAVNQSKQTT